MGAAAAVIVRKQREIVDCYRAAHATAPTQARDPGELGVEHSMIFKGLVRRAVLRDVGGGRYYLDEPAWEAFGNSRRRLVLMALILALLAVIVVSLGVQRSR